MALFSNDGKGASVGAIEMRDEDQGKLDQKEYTSSFQNFSSLLAISSDGDTSTTNKRPASPVKSSNSRPSEVQNAKSYCASRTGSSTNRSDAASVVSNESRQNPLERDVLDEERAENFDQSCNGPSASSRSPSSSQERDASLASEKSLKEPPSPCSSPSLSHPSTNSRKRKRSESEGTPAKPTRADFTDAQNTRNNSKSPKVPTIIRQDGLTPIEEHDPNPVSGTARAQAFTFNGTPAITTPGTEVENIFDENGTASSSQLAKKAVKAERRLPGRKRQPNPDINIEADLRRQLQLKTNYRAVAKALKPILAELARRSIEEIKEDVDAYKKHEQYEAVLQQINDRLSKRLAHLEETYRLKRKYAEKVSQAERVAKREECAVSLTAHQHILIAKRLL